MKIQSKAIGLVSITALLLLKRELEGCCRPAAHYPVLWSPHSKSHGNNNATIMYIHEQCAGTCGTRRCCYNNKHVLNISHAKYSLL